MYNFQGDWKEFLTVTDCGLGHNFASFVWDANTSSLFSNGYALKFASNTSWIIVSNSQNFITKKNANILIYLKVAEKNPCQMYEKRLFNLSDALGTMKCTVGNIYNNNAL